jgi:hypothetical protein
MFDFHTMVNVIVNNAIVHGADMVFWEYFNKVFLALLNIFASTIHYNLYGLENGT